MKISTRGVSLIKRFEGLAQKAYYCPAGKLTIGYGHVILPEDRMGKDSVITEQQAEVLLSKDLTLFEKGVTSLVKVPLTQGQFDALVSFAFNLGLGRLAKSTLLRKVNAGDHAGAAQEFGKWVFAAGNRLRGLVLRREAEALLYAS